MNLSEDAIRWALNHLMILNDSDLFPRPIELDIVATLETNAVSAIASLDLTQHEPGPSRRFIVPKDDISYRAATQLDPLDSIILASLMYQYGSLVEKARRPVDEKTVFSYRFKPEPW